MGKDLLAKDRLDQASVEVQQAVGRVKDPLEQFRNLTTNFMLTATYYGGERWLRTEIPIELQHREDLTTAPTLVPMPNVVAGLHRITDAIDRANPNDARLQAPLCYKEEKRLEKQPLSLIGNAYREITDAGTFFALALVRWPTVYMEPYADEIVSIMQQQTPEDAVSLGLSGLAWAVRNPASPNIPSWCGVDPSIQQLQPLSQDIAIQLITQELLPSPD